jgi:polyisoprenoid-binding protein YceI
LSAVEASFLRCVSISILPVRRVHEPGIDGPVTTNEEIVMTAVGIATEDRATLSAPPSGSWAIDPAHSVVGFAVRHLMSKVRGRFDEFSGQITIAENRHGSCVQVEIALASVDTGQPMRDTHLRSAEFFNVEQHPTMTFTSTCLREVHGSWMLTGELTIRGISRSVAIALEFLGLDPTGMQGEPRIGFQGRTSINRSDFGIDFGLAETGKIVVGDRVDIMLDIEAALIA